MLVVIHNFLLREGKSGRLSDSQPKPVEDHRGSSEVRKKVLNFEIGNLARGRCQERKASPLKMQLSHCGTAEKKKRENRVGFSGSECLTPP